MAVTKISLERQVTIDSNIDMSSAFKVTNLAAPTGNNDAATKGYVDAAIQGLDIKQSVRCATTGNITLTALQAIDGYTTLAGDRVLVKDQTTGLQNGIYYAAVGAWTRTEDCAVGVNARGFFVFSEQGTVNDDSGWVVSNNAAAVVNTDALTFVQFSGAGQVLAGNGMTKSGNTLNVVTASSARVVVNADNIDLATAGTSGTYTKVTTDAYGRVTSGTTIAATDLPTGIDASKIGAGQVSNAEYACISPARGSFQDQIDSRLTAADYIVREVPSGLVNGSNAVYSLVKTPNPGGCEHVYLNGLLQEAGAGNDYTISVNTITFSSAPKNGSKIHVTYFKSEAVPSYVS